MVGSDRFFSKFVFHLFASFDHCALLFCCRILPGEANLHGRLRRELFHGEPRLHDGGSPARSHVLLRGGRVQPRPPLSDVIIHTRDVIVTHSLGSGTAVDRFLSQLIQGERILF